LIGVVGEIGTGKTSLLKAFISELEKNSGVVAVENYEAGNSDSRNVPKRSFGIFKRYVSYLGYRHIIAFILERLM